MLFLLVSGFYFLLQPVVLTRKKPSVVLLLVLAIVLMEWVTSYLVGIIQALLSSPPKNKFLNGFISRLSSFFSSSFSVDADADDVT